MTDNHNPRQLDWVGLPKRRGRPRIHANAAARQRAYRERMKARQEAVAAAQEQRIPRRMLRWFMGLLHLSRS